MNIELISSRIVAADCIEFVAAVPDMVQTFPSSYSAPAEYGSAQCCGRLYWGVDADGPLSALTDEDLERLCQDPSIDWEIDSNC